MFLVTYAIRGFVFAAFGGSKKPPKVILYLGSVISPAVICMLVVYCFRNTQILSHPHGLPELIATVVCVALHLWRRNPLLSIGSGLWDTYNMATGILGDTLSYIRLYALGLAGGMLGGAFNNLGLMIMGGSTAGATWQWLPFILVLVVGHILNLAMSALGAFVHPLRLTFVEYFKNSGYEGKGTLYSPFKK